jgi:hypothetical protein
MAIWPFGRFSGKLDSLIEPHDHIPDSGAAGERLGRDERDDKGKDEEAESRKRKREEETSEDDKESDRVLFGGQLQPRERAALDTACSVPASLPALFALFALLVAYASHNKQVNSCKRERPLLFNV